MDATARFRVIHPSVVSWTAGFVLTLTCACTDAGGRTTGTTFSTLGDDDGDDTVEAETTDESATDNDSDDGETTQTEDTGDESPDDECIPAPPPMIPGFHVAVDGTPAGDGSKRSPWDLATALAGPPALTPGSTLLVHEGIYAGAFVAELDGARGAPIVVRSAPGEWAVIDGAPSTQTTLEIQGSWTVYRDFEVTNTNPERFGGRPGGVNVYAANAELVNLVIHDGGGNGFWSTAVDSTWYGCLVYNNGYDDDDRPHGHGIYMQNAEGTKRVRDNVIFANYSFGIHAYTEGGSIEGFDVEGNVWFGSGWAADGLGNEKDNCLIGGSQPAARVGLRDNIGWATPDDARSVRLGYDDPDNEDVELEANYFVGRTNFARPWSSVSLVDNVFVGPLTGVDPFDYPDNEYDVQPGDAQVFIRPNAYDPLRALIAIHNPTGLPELELDLGELFVERVHLELRNAQDYFAAPALVTTLEDGHVLVPLTGLGVAQPIGNPSGLDASERTGSAFVVFIAQATPCA